MNRPSDSIIATSTRLTIRVAIGLCACAITLAAQNPPRRLILADTAPGAADRTPRADTVPPIPRLVSVGRAAPTRPAAPSAPRYGAGLLREAFVRDQTLLGLAVYAPSFATTVTNDPVAWTASFMVVGAGSYLLASEVARNMTITDPMRWLATQSAVRGGLAGLGLTYAADVDRHNRAAGVFFGSVIGTTVALAFGRGMTDGEVAATTFAADLGAASAFGLSHMADPSATTRARVGMSSLGALAGYPIGYLYANTSRYRVTPGDVTTLWASSAVGALAGGAFVTNGHPDSRTVATALTAGALVGAVFGDRLLVQPYDHSPEEGQIVGLWAGGGALMGAGVAAVVGASREHLSGATEAFMAGGAITGMILAEQYLRPKRGGTRAMSRVQLDPAGMLSVAAGASGNHSLLRWTF